VSCPRDAGHGSGPFVDGRCYWCWKRLALAGRPLPPEIRAYAWSAPTPPTTWRDASELAVAAEVDRVHRAEFGRVGLALLRAIYASGRRE
jgi:hypothetical protein